jgi:drug/metabolite transporter (DMT)-like permease
VSKPTNNAAIAGSLLLVVILWGGNNAGTKWLVTTLPPILTGSLRFLLAGLLLLAALRFTKWPGEFEKPTPELRRQLWLRGGLSLGTFLIAFSWALRMTSA